MDTLLQAINLVAPLLALPPLLLKAFVGVEGGDVTHPDGAIQVTEPTRSVVLRRIPRPLKLFALGITADDPNLDDMALTTMMAQAYVGRNVRVQVMTAAQYVREQVDTFRGFVALAGLAYNAGPTGARRVVDAFGGDMYTTARQFHKGIGPATNQVTVQPGVEATDGATGQKYTRFPVTANNSGKEIFQYMYLRQVPNRNFGLLDFIYQPQLLKARGLYEPAFDLPPAPDTRDHALLVVEGQFQISSDGAGSTTTMFNTNPISQRDPRWKDIRLGFSSEGRTIGSDGCTLTAMTMIANGYGFTETPATLNEKMKALGAGGGFIDALIVFAGLERACAGMDLLGVFNCRDVAAPLGDIDAALAAGRPVLVEVDRAPGPTTNFHWVVLIGKQGNDYLMRDPFPVPAESGDALVNARYGMGRPVEQTISFVVYYTGPRKPTPPRPTPNTGGQVVVVVNNDPDIIAVGGLALRGTPEVGNNLIKRLPAGTELATLETAQVVRAKIGVPNQWLNVATNGNQGFVAAWLVQEKSGTRAIARAGAKAPTTLARRSGTRRVDAPVSEPDAPPVMQPPLRVVVMLTIKGPTKVAGKKAVAISLRAKPSTGKIIVELKPNVVVEVVEAPKAALKKIGVRGKWIKVRDSAGNIGYVAGVYVIERVKKTSG